MSADEFPVSDLWLFGAEWSSGIAMPWWEAGWRRTGLTNTPIISKRDEIDSTASHLAQIDSGLRSRFLAFPAGEERLSD